MFQDKDIILIRQFCINSAVPVLAGTKEPVTLERYLEIVQKIEDYLMQEVDKQKTQLGRE